MPMEQFRKRGGALIADASGNPCDALVGRFEQAPRPNAVVRRYRGQPSPLVRSGDGSWRTGRLDMVMRGDFDLLAAAEA